MSGQVTGWLLRNAPPALEHTAADRSLLRVLLVLADRADLDGRHARLPIRDIAERALLSTRSVDVYLARAVADGWLEVTKRGSAHWPTEYRFIHYAPVDKSILGRSPDCVLDEPLAQSDCVDKTQSEHPLTQSGPRAKTQSGPRRTFLRSKTSLTRSAAAPPALGTDGTAEDGSPPPEGWQDTLKRTGSTWRPLPGRQT